MSNLAEAQRAAGGGESGPAETGVVGVLRKIDEGLARVEEVVLSLCLTALLAVGVYGAIKSRFFPPMPFWAAEIVRYSVFFIGLCGAALAAQSERLFNIDMFMRYLGPRTKLVMRMLTSAFAIVVCVILLRASLFMRAHAIENEGEVIKSMQGVLALPIAMVLISAHLALHLLIDGIYLVTGKLPEGGGAEPKAH